MSHVKKGHLTASKEWAKHLRPWWKKHFWHKHRRVEKQVAKEQANDPRR
jgi:hypothetical protein